MGTPIGPFDPVLPPAPDTYDPSDLSQGGEIPTLTGPTPEPAPEPTPEPDPTPAPDA